jgi:hypothetical protein
MKKATPRSINIPDIHNLSRKELETALEGTKRKSFELLVHVGFLNNSSQINGDMEGPFLSTSEYPDEWTQIAKLGGCPRWTIEGKIPTVDFHKSHLKNATNWALNRNLVKKETWWKAPHWDEDGETRFFLCQSKKEAQAQTETPRKVTPCEVLVAENRLKDFWNQRKKTKPNGQNPWHTKSMILTLIIELAAQKGWNKFPMGIFWNELLDPPNLSAPRASLSPTRITSNPQIQILTQP